MAAAGDPVATGLAQSLGRPGGHFTGLSLQAVETTGKRLELLKELVPGTAPVAVLWEPRAVRVPLSWQAAEAAARARGWRLHSLEVRDGGEIERAFTAATSARGGLLVHPSPLPDENAGRIAVLAVKSRLPGMYPLRPYVEAGGLIYYGANLVEIWRRAAVFVDKIRKGAKPWRSAHRAADEVRARDQPQSREGDRTYDRPVDAVASG